jgi:phage terminase large subunit-like protein
MTILLPDEADLAALGIFGQRLEEEPVDPRIEWRATARPEQLLPPDPWRVFYLQGGRGSGKRAAGLRASLT